VPDPRPLDGRAPAPSRARAVATLWVAAVAVVGLAALGERTWLARDLPLAAAPPPPPSPVAPRERPSSPFLLVVIDGLREAAVATMPAWRALAAEGEATGGTRGVAAASGVALVGDPTMSAPCVRAIVTGRRPDLWASFRNFDPVPVEGSVIQLLAARRLRVAHAGDGLLPRLCPDAYRPDDVATVPRALLRTVRELDDRTFPRALEFARDPTVDVLTVHLVAVDLTGHASGATSEAYAAAVAEADARLGELVLAFRREHTGAHVLVTADHGLSPAGTHGAGEPEARRAPFVLLGPRVALRRGLELAQEALASTVAVMLHLRPPPLAEAPPVLGVLRLTTAERRAALDAFAATRAAALAAAGRPLEAHALEEVRAAAAAGGRGGPGEPALLRALLALDAPPSRRAAAPVAALALAVVAFLLVLAGARSGAPAGAIAAWGVVVAGLACAGAGSLVHRASVGAAPAAAFARGLPCLAGAVAVAVVALRRGAVRARRGPVAVAADGRVAGGPWPAPPFAGAALAGAAVALVRSMRLPIDGVVHLPVLVGATLVVGAGLASWRAGAAASRRVRVGFPLAVLAFVATTRALELAWGETWLLAEGTSVLAPVAVLAGFAAVAALGARVPSRGGAANAAWLLLAAVAGFHALGGAESLGRLDPGHAFVPGAAGASPPSTWAEGLLGAAARHAVLWAVLLAAAHASWRRGDAAARGPAVVASLAVGVATGAAVLVAAASAWSAWSWWMVCAVPVVALAAVDAVALAAAGSALAAVARARPGTTVRGGPGGRG